MKKIFLFSGSAVLLATAVLLTGRNDDVHQPETPKISEAVSEPDQKVLNAALKSPETFRAEDADSTLPEIPPVPSERPRMLSEVKKPEKQKTKRNPVAVETLPFHHDYQSMRKEEIRNPDSKENRQGVVSLLQARQRRTGNEF